MDSQVTMSNISKKKVLFVITKSNWGGAQRYVYDLATSLPDEQFDVTVALGGTGGHGAKTGALYEALLANGTKTIFVSAFTRDVFLLNDLRAMFELVKIFRRERPDIVHLNSSKAGGVGALAARIAGVHRIIFTAHGLPHEEPRPFLARMLIWIVTWATFLLCHRVIAISQNDYKSAKRFPFCASKIRLIHNGISSVGFDPRDISRLTLQSFKPFVISDGDILIGTIAELTKNKGLDFLINAFRVVSETHNNVRLLIIGGGEEQGRLQALIDEKHLSEKVTLIGFVPRASVFLRALDIFALPSLKEGLPYVLLEAGMAKLPIVATRVGGIPDILEEGATGLLVEPRNSIELAEKIITLVEDSRLRVTLAENLYEKVTVQFSFRKMLDVAVKTYTS